MCFSIILLVVILLIFEEEQINNNYYQITWSNCDINGNYTIQNNSTEEKTVIVKYNIKLQKGEKVTKYKEIKLYAKTSREINVYKNVDIKVEDILTLDIDIVKWYFLAEIKSVIIVLVMILITIVLALCYYVHVKKED